jgi:Holliday junction resolvase RusA-like endonuclease
MQPAPRRNAEPAPIEVPVARRRVVAFEIPGQPQAWQRAGSRIVQARDGRQFVSHYTKAKTRAEERTVRAIAADAMDMTPPLAGPLAIELVAHMMVPASWSRSKRQRALAGLLLPTTKPDLDNLAKLVKDALNRIVYRDDAQVVRATLSKLYAERPRTKITVTALDAEAAS